MAHLDENNNMKVVIDLRSDTVTKPTPEMLDAIMRAEVGDDVYKEDPTANELEARVAELFGAEEALFFPTGSMANQAAIKLHTQPGEQLICHEWAHVYNYEGGGVSFNSGVSCKLLAGIHLRCFRINTRLKLASMTETNDGQPTPIEVGKYISDRCFTITPGSFLASNEIASGLAKLPQIPS